MGVGDPEPPVLYADPGQGAAVQTDPAIAEVAKRVAYLPIGLSLAGAVLSDGVSGKEWLSEAQRVAEIRLDRYSEGSRHKSCGLFRCERREEEIVLAVERPCHRSAELANVLASSRFFGSSTKAVRLLLRQTAVGLRSGRRRLRKARGRTMRCPAS
jgi:hypothetical protein